MKNLLVTLVILGSMSSTSLAIRCYECNSATGSCDRNELGRIVECQRETCYFELVGGPVGNYKRECGGPPAMPGAGPRNYCHTQDGKAFCTCTSDLCNDVYNTAWENTGFGGEGGHFFEDYEDEKRPLPAPISGSTTVRYTSVLPTSICIFIINKFVY